MEMYSVFSKDTSVPPFSSIFLHVANHDFFSFPGYSLQTENNVCQNKYIIKYLINPSDSPTAKFLSLYKNKIS
jgi:hypothetical protein